MSEERPWETEPDSLDFEADGLPCAIRRNPRWGTWCGYVGVDDGHPLFGLPVNHPLKLPAAWFEGRSIMDGCSPFDLFVHALRGKELVEACPISLAFEVHGGVNFADDSVPDRDADGRWWFGFDCGHAGDLAPGLGDITGMVNEIVESMPEEAREIMRKIMVQDRGVYRDQQFVVSECQSLAAQLVAVVSVLQKERT